MRTVALIAGLLIGVLALMIGVVLLIGWRLPERHTATRSVRLSQSPRDVYALVRNFEAAPRWRSDLKDIEMLSAVDGRTRFRERGSNGEITFEVDEDIPNKQIITRILDTDLGFGGQWTFEFLDEEVGCTLRITEHGEVSNAFFRFMSRYVFGHTATIDRYLRDLSAAFGETYEPE